MIRLQETTRINTPIERCFDLSRSDKMDAGVRHLFYYALNPNWSSIAGR